MKQRWTQAELIEIFSLHTTERELLTSTTDHNLLGFTVLLKFFQHEGRFPQDPSEVPASLVDYLAQQLDVVPDIFSQYNWQGRSIRQHRAKIREWLGFRPYADKDQEMIANWLQEEILPQTQKIDFVIDSVYQRLQSQQIEPPSSAQLERLIRSTLHSYENNIFATVFNRLTTKIQLALDTLLESAEPTKTEETETLQTSHTPLYQIKQSVGEANLKNVLRATARLELLQDISLPTDLLTDVPPSLVTRYRQRAAVESPSHMRAHPAPIRYTLLAALCWSRQREITDDLVESLLQIVNCFMTSAPLLFTYIAPAPRLTFDSLGALCVAAIFLNKCEYKATLPSIRIYNLWQMNCCMPSRPRLFDSIATTISGILLSQNECREQNDKEGRDGSRMDSRSFNVTTVTREAPRVDASGIGECYRPFGELGQEVEKATDCYRSH